MKMWKTKDTTGKRTTNYDNNKKVFKKNDLINGLEYGIEWGVPCGSLRVLEDNIRYKDCYRVSLETYYDGVAHQFIGNLKEINNWLKKF